MAGGAPPFFRLAFLLSFLILSSNFLPFSVSPWISCKTDLLAGCKAHVNCVRLIDGRLFAATVDGRLKSFFGTSVESDLQIPELPSSLCAFSVSGVFTSQYL